MSEFDKDAERERLREKFAEEEAERAATKHMSELLLQGMTMTDRHCPECGAPLFRDDDRTFCPECERRVAETEEPPASPAAAASGDEGATTGTSRVESSPTATGAGPRADLEAALERAAAAAAAADDPRTAREHLEAARAAIEALSALDET